MLQDICKQRGLPDLLLLLAWPRVSQESFHPASQLSCSSMEAHLTHLYMCCKRAITGFCPHQASTVKALWDHILELFCNVPWSGDSCHCDTNQMDFRMSITNDKWGCAAIATSRLNTRPCTKHLPCILLYPAGPREADSACQHHIIHLVTQQTLEVMFQGLRYNMC